MPKKCKMDVLQESVEGRSSDPGTTKETEPVPNAGYTICRLTEGVTEANRAILSRLIELYFSCEPVARAFKVVDGRKLSPIFMDFLLRPINQGYSFVAVDDHTQEVIGLLVNLVSNIDDDDVGVLLKGLDNEAEKELVMFWLALTRNPFFGSLYQTLANEKVYCLDYMVVDDNYRKRGISGALVLAAIELAKELKFPVIRSELSNAFTEITSDRMGYTERYKLPYEDFVDSKGNRIFPVVKPPHTHLVVSILYMNEYKSKHNPDQPQKG